MRTIFADRMMNTHKSFIREILKVTEKPEMISFAGGLPNPDLFPVKGTAEAAFNVLMENGNEILQYATTEGYYPLRKLIAERYARRGLSVSVDEILIVNGSQQGLDLIGKVFINKWDKVIIERPGYLGAIQAFGLYEPEFIPVELCSDGIDLQKLSETIENDNIKLIYTIPNFQNPSGTVYSNENRIQLARMISNMHTIIVEDDAYGELRFIGQDQPLLKNFCKDKSILLGSFSKIVAPGLRMGWICASKEIIDKLVTVKQATDLHSNYLSQWVIYRYIKDNDIEMHISNIRSAYRRQRNAMVSCLENYFPDGVKFTSPEGGMFLWLTLPKGIDSMELFNMSIENNVAFVPGNPFYVDGGGSNTLRLNYSNSSEEDITYGMKILSNCIKDLIIK